MLTITMTCPLPNGIHARPASELEVITNQFKAEIGLLNLKNQRTANAKSVLSLIGADVSFGDQCEFTISGEDEQQAWQRLKDFIEHEFEHTDAPLAQNAVSQDSPLPYSLSAANPLHLRGKGVSKGIGIGKPVVADSIDLAELARQEPESAPEQTLNDIKHGWQRLGESLQQSVEHASGDAKPVLQAQLKMLQDSEFTASLFNHPQAKNPLHAVALTCATLCESLQASSNRYLQERALDIQDICIRLAALLVNRPLKTDIKLTEDSIVISNGLLTPSQLLSLAGQSIKGIVMGDGGDTSHTVILARSFGIPLLTGVKNIVAFVQSSKSLIVDANSGVVITDPNPQTQVYYQHELAKSARINQRLNQYTTQQVTTRDGVKIDVAANIAIALEGKKAFTSGADGIGLFRTEMIFCERSEAPSEEEQFETYKEILIAAAGKKVVIRTLDIGGDKPCEYLGLPEEENPFLGYRAIRIYPDYMTIFHSQIRALLRASQFGPLHIMVPMISTVDEVKWLHEQFSAIQDELHSAGQATGDWKLGIMVEVPSALYILEKAAQWIDFISIGSNDLTQYFFACDRGNQQVSYLYDYLTPCFLALLHDIVSRATAAGLSVSLCGEMAADNKALPLLVGLGLTQLSMSATAIARTKERIATLDQSLCRQLFEAAVDTDNSQQVKALLADFERAQQAKPALSADLILLDTDIDSKTEVIKVLTDNLEIAQRVTGAADVERAIWAREQVFSTALGFSVAIPHCKSEHVLHNSISMMRLNSPITWGDGVDVQLVFMLTVSEQDGKDSHMKLFSKLARKLIHEDFRQSLMDKPDADSIFALLSSQLAD